MLFLPDTVKTSSMGEGDPPVSKCPCNTESLLKLVADENLAISPSCTDTSMTALQNPSIMTTRASIDVCQAAAQCCNKKLLFTPIEHVSLNEHLIMKVNQCSVI